ncbi:serine/threonine-protein kinase [Nocardioides sp. R-C-SC26]|uniref:serine/threonine protein kinase n=1 Tax=Nocardioides sp. R-C-SC26 TaxID=2870414 RepID=UPI001E2E5690|nr:serine/threonine-protein kinase [Nocardioides sp. R-C-SC26]
MSSDPVVSRVGEYVLLAKLGEGGMGIVHLARHPDGRRVALKVLRPHIVGDDESRRRLEREVSSLRRVRSRWVAEVLDADPWAPVPYVATRYVPGHSLHDHVHHEGPIAGPDLLWFAASLAEALAAVHAVGVLHRDVKPANVVMEGRTPILIDFGLARVADDPRLTHTGWLLGTPGYLAPEILYGEDASAASDVHSWAATVAFAGTGRAPFGGGPSMAIMDRVRRGEFDLTGVEPEALRGALTAALDPEPARRPTLDQLLSWLRPQTTRPGPVLAPPPGQEIAPEAEDPFTIPLALAAQARGAGLADEVAPAVPSHAAPTLVQPAAGTGLAVGLASAGPILASAAPAPTLVDPAPQKSTAVLSQGAALAMSPAAPVAPPRPSTPAPPVPPTTGSAGPWGPPSAYPASHHSGYDGVGDADLYGYGAPPPEQVSAAERVRRGVLLLALVVAIASATAAVPWVTLALLCVATWLLRSGSMAASGARARRELRGRRWYDGVQLLVHAPWHLVQSIPSTILLLLWSAGLGASAGLLCYAVRAGIAGTLVACGATFAVSLWWGPGGRRVRLPVSRAAMPLARSTGPWLLAVAVVGVLALAGGLATETYGVNWLPWDSRPSVSR